MALIKRVVVALLVFLLFGWAAPVLATDQTVPDSPWYTVNESGEAEIHLYFAWSSTCPHCSRAKPFIEQLEREHSWLIIHWLQLDGDHQENVAQVAQLADSLGVTVRSVPAFLFCEDIVVGYRSDQDTGAQLKQRLISCQARIQTQVDEQTVEEPPEDGRVISLPVIGSVDPDTVSLPTFTVVIASLDAFNPCAFFVLVFLLSLLVHARSRPRMAMIGGTFVLVSGVVYFALMAAWLNVFLLFGTLPAVTIVAGLVAFVIATVNIKDYFWFGRGMTLSIPDAAKPRLFERMRRLTTSSRFPLILMGTVTLALAANTYELLCTAGFPLVFTRVLTLQELPTFSYYAYLVLYNVVYVVPLLAIVGVFVWTLGSRKLSEQAGRSLKLLSGLMMLGLGLVLLFAPELLANLLIAPLILVAALVTTGVIGLVGRAREDLTSGARGQPH